MLTLNLVDWLTIGAYLALSLAIGVYFTRRASRSEEDYFLSGRTLPWWLLGTSMVATTFALDTPLAIAQMIVSKGLYANAIWLSLAIGHLFVAMFLAGRWRRAGIVTDAELCEVRYGGRSAAALRGFKGGFSAFVLNGLTLGGVLFAVKQICFAFGVDTPSEPGVAEPLLSRANLVLLGAVGLTLAYTVTAGFWGVIATDFVQFVLAIVGAVVVAGYALLDPRVGGLSGMVEKARALGDGRALRLVPEGLTTEPLDSAVLDIGVLRADDQGLTFLVYVFIMWWAYKNADGGGVLIQRMSAARDARQATLGTLWFCLAHYVLRWWPWALVGLCALTVLGVDDGMSPEALAHVANGAYPRMVVEVVPEGLRGLVLAYFAAAFMSTIDTHLNLGAAYLVNDVYRRFLVRAASERHYVWVGRFASLVIIGLAFFAAQFTRSFEHLLGFILNLVAGAGSVFLLRWFWWRVSAWSELAALGASLAIGGGLMILNALTDDPAARIPFWQVTIANVVGSGAVWLTVTFLTAPAPMERLVDFYRRTRPLGAWGPVRRAAGLPPEPLPYRAVAAWLAAVAACFGSLFAIRDLLAGDAARGAVTLAIAVACAAWVVRSVLLEHPPGDSGAQTTA